MKKILIDWQYLSWCDNKSGWIRGEGNTMPSLFALVGGKIGRNYTSCGKWWWSWSSEYKRLNLWPISIWFR